MTSRSGLRCLARLIDRLWHKFGWTAAPSRAILEALEPRTLLSIAPIGSPIAVDSGTAPLNINPQIATAANGDFVVVWATGPTGNIAWRLFDSSGTPLTDETITTNMISNAGAGGFAPAAPSHTQALHPQQFDVAMDPAGDFVIAWQAADDIYAQRYDPSGDPVGNALNVTNTGSDVQETAPAVAIDAAGDFAVTWLADTTVGINIKTMTPASYYDKIDQTLHKAVRHSTAEATAISHNGYTTSVVEARRFDATGSAGEVIQVSPIAVNPPVGTLSGGFATALNPEVAMDAAGDFTVAWDTVGYAPQKTLVSPLTKTSSLSSPYYNAQNHLVQTTLHYYTGAAFNYNMSPTGVKALAQRYTAAGATQGAALPAITKSPSTAAGQIVGIDSKLSMDASGDFALTAAVQYEKSQIKTQTGSSATATYYATSSVISSQRYSAAGKAIGSLATVATATSTGFFSLAPLNGTSAQLTNLATAMDSSGNLLVVWDQSAFDNASNTIVGAGLFGRRYNAAGKAQETQPSAIPLAAGGGSGSGGFGGPFSPAVAFAGGIIDLTLQSKGSASTDVFAAAFRPVLPASQVVFTVQPQTGSAGTLAEIDVTVEDANGFVVTDGSSTVKLSVFSGTAGAALGGTTSVTTVNGVAAFTNVSLARGGKYVLKATDGSLPSATSSPFDILTTPTQLAFTTQPANGTAGTTLSAFTVSVRDAHGDLSVEDGSTVTLSVATGPNSIAGTFAAVAVNGVATFNNLSLESSGTYTLLASDPGLAAATSSKFIMTAGAAANFEFSTNPADTTAGTKFTVRVSATDALGNPAILDHSKVILEIFGTNPAGTLTGAGTTMTLTGGVATFTGLTIPTTGTFTLAAFSNAMGVASSNSFTITPAAASKLVFAQQPLDNTAGQPLDPAVEVDLVDTFGNLVATDSSIALITVASAPKGAASLTGAQSESAVAGVSTFSDLVLTTAGTYTLKATEGKFSATSPKFTIFPNLPSKLVILSQPAAGSVGAVAGNAIKPAITVAVEDQYGNIETGNSSLITMTVNSTASLFGTGTASALKGIATFNNLILDAAGTFTLGAADGSLANATSNSFSISPAAAATLRFLQQPSDVTFGQTMSTATSMQLLDAFGNLVIADHSTVTLKIASGPAGAKLFGKFSAAASNGIATFGGLTLQTLGTYTLAAADGKLAGDSSNSFQVLAAASRR